jgi:dihydroorotate dehydrogenase
MTNFENYDYSLGKGDKLLALIRRAFKNHAEFRHDCLEPFARLSPLWGGRIARDERLKRTISFADGSSPIVLCSPIVLAAGANKRATNIMAYANLGFGGITVGTATRNSRIGNTHRPRVGLDEANRIIHNAMGLNNDGIEQISNRVECQIRKTRKNNFAVGISVAETPGLIPEHRLLDIRLSFETAYQTESDYIEINVSCPNTGENRLDLDTSFMEDVFKGIEHFKSLLSVKRPVYAKLSPDLTDDQLLKLLELVSKYGINGVVLGNTYPSDKLSYELPALNDAGGRGGVSGRPLYENTINKTLLAKENFPNLSIVSCGGIDHGFKVCDLLKAGADFVQAYTAVAFRWMAVQKMNQEFIARTNMNNLDLEVL